MEQKIHARMRLESMPLVISGQFNALRRFTEQTNNLYYRWEEEKAPLAKTIGHRGFEVNQESPQTLFNKKVLRHQLQGILYNSAFVSCVALFETLLKDICEVVSDPKKITPDEIQGRSYIQKSKTFLTKVVGISLDEKETLWKELVTYSEIRNKIIHEQGNISISNPDHKHPLIEKIRKMNGVEVNTFWEEYVAILITSTDFIFTYIKVASEYLNFVNEKLIKQIDEEFSRHTPPIVIPTSPRAN